MWNIGFRKYLEEILESFMGEISYQWSKGFTNFELLLSKEGDDTVLVQLIEDKVKLQEELSYDEMYEVLVTDNSMAYLYLFQDVLEELEDPDSKSIMVNSYLKDILEQMSPIFVGRKEQMEIAKEEPKLDLVSGMKFVDNGIEYEQLALAI